MKPLRPDTTNLTVEFHAVQLEDLELGEQRDLWRQATAELVPA